MKQKIVVKVPVKCNKCKNKVMEKAASEPDVSSVAMDGDKLVVIGDHIDVVKLTKSLQKKFGFATIEKVEELKKEEKEEEKDVYMNPFHSYGQPYYYMDDPNPSFCSIM